jgi:Transglycosylase SLT domain
MNAIARTESGGLGMSALSPKGAIGTYQLMPGTARALGVDPHDPAGNKRGAYMLMQQLLDRYHGNVAEAVGAYNWNPRGMDRFLAGKATLPNETRNYIGKVLGRAGQSGDVTVGSVTIHIGGSNASTSQIQQAVTRGISDAMEKRTQRNLAEFNDLGWSY